MAPKVPMGILVAGAYAIDMVWGVFYVAGIEGLPKAERKTTSVWSHGLFMAVSWSALAGLITRRITGGGRSGVLAGLLVFSHWVVDFITKPMTAVFADDTGLPLLFDDRQSVGLGLYRSKVGVNGGEYGSLILGLVVYWLTRRAERGSGA